MVQGRNLVGHHRRGALPVLRELGRGDGHVYEARHAVVGRRLAIKVLTTCARGSSAERFFHEATRRGARATCNRAGA